MDNSLEGIIQSAKSAIIVLPKNPYFDQVAAGLGLYLGLKGKLDVQVVSQSPMTVEFNRLVGVDKISADLGNKNLVMKFKDYQADGIERVSYDIEGGEFKLSVIPKPQVTPPNKDQVVISYSGVSADTVFIIGGANDSHFPLLSSNELASAKKVHIGINQLSTSIQGIISLARPSSSTSELVGHLLKAANIEISQDMATNLLMGIYEGSRNFGNSSVNKDTFVLASELMAAGGVHKPKDKADRRTFPQGAIPGEKPKINLQPAPTSAPTPKPHSPLTQQSPPPQQQAQSQTQTQDEAPEHTDEDAPPKSWLEPKVMSSSDPTVN